MTTARPPDSSYSKHRQKMADRSAAVSREGRDIGAIPAVVDPKRKEGCASSLARFCSTYFPDTFYRPFSADHTKAIGRIETAVLRGGLFAFAMPRGMGKTTLCEAAAEWALLYGYHAFVMLIGATKDDAVERLESIKMELETNDLLAQDFPEVCYPVRCLEGITQRAGAQLSQGERTHLGWTADEVVLPTIPDSKASGARIRVAGITGRIRGAKANRVDGRMIRPSLVIIDDPQTDESARSETQCEARERVLGGAVLGLAGPGERIAGFMPCTVIQPGDMAERILDRKRHPEWQGERFQMLYSLPSDEKLWNQYEALLREELEAGNAQHPAATAFYRENREAMDAGAAVSWEHRLLEHEASALQHAMNLRILNPIAFAAEYQNDPVASEELVLRCDSAVVARKTNGRKRRVVPIEAEYLTCHIDVHDKLLYWAVVAWTPDFGGAVVDYGTYPEQRALTFQMRGARVGLKHKHRRMETEAAVMAGLGVLVDELFSPSAWRREADGAAVDIDLAAIDCRYLQSTVMEFIRRSPHRARLMPYQGFGVRAKDKPYAQYKRRPGDRNGLGWRIPSARGTKLLRTINADVNEWKTFVHGAWNAPAGSTEYLELWQAKPHRHQLFADHQAAEIGRLVEVAGVSKYEWEQMPARPDNHFLDNIVGAAVCASIRGARRRSAEEQRAARGTNGRKRNIIFSW